MVVVLNAHALIALIAQSVEVFRYETYGYLLISEKKNNQVVEAAISYQTAKRNGFNEVEDSNRSEKVYAWTKEIANVVDGFHSHTYSPRQRLKAEPTETDISQMTNGHFEIIVGIQRQKRRRYNRDWHEIDLGLKGSINGYNFLLRCWKKTDPKGVTEQKLKLS
ncbi:MAG: hypothetical protein ACOCWG_04030 [bacterium]